MLEPLPPPPRRPFPGVGQAVLLLVLLWGILLLIGLFLLVVLGVSPLGTEDAESPLSTPFLIILPNTVAFAVVTLVGWKLSRAPARLVFPFRRFHPALLIPVGVASVGAVLVGSSVDTVLRLLPLPEVLDSVMADLEEILRQMFQETFWPSLVAVVIVAPLTEELFFRGLLLHGFRGRFRAASAVTLSAFFFGVVHGTPNQLVVGFGAGLFLGWLLIRSGNLWLPVFAHAFFNAQPALAARWMPVEDVVPAAEFDPGLLMVGVTLLVLGIAATRRFCPPAPSVVAPPPQAM